METIFEYLTTWVMSFGIGNTLYFLFGGIAFYFFWVLNRERFSHLRIQIKQRANSIQIKKEILYSVRTLGIFAAIDLLAYYFETRGWTKIYKEVSDYGTWYFFGSIIIMLIVHDAYFYFTHRFMHLSPVYKYVHKVHHESVDTTPFTAFSFHFLESIVEYGITFVVIFTIPSHFYSLLIFQILQTAFNVAGHMGYEFYPSGWTRFPFLKFKTTGTHHNMHHAKFNGNYGLYFTWWDKIFGTEFPDYENSFEEIAKRSLR
jgi:sterol desaturase/sphingolipid hydroxylase (fatty acid hydroxylase superfamily)